MPIATGLAIAGGLAAAGSVGSAAIGAHAAGEAANAQTNAADYAANLQAQEAQNSLNFETSVYNNQQQQLAPWLGAGQAGLANLANLLGVQFPSSSAGAGGSPIPGGAGAGGSNGGAPLVGSSTGNPAQPINGPRPNAAQPFPFSQQNGGSPPMAGTLPLNGQKNVPGAPGGAAVPNAPMPTAANPTAGLSSLAGLVNPGLGASGSLLQPYGEKFVAPQLNESTDPGYMARLKLAQDAMTNSASARGGLLSGNTAAALGQMSQDYASSEYGNVYNRALQGYNTNYNVFEQGQTNTFNRLAALAGIGQTATQQLGNAGQAAASGVNSTLMNAGNMIGQNINNAGAARGSGYVGAGNAWGGALGNLGNLGTMYALLNSGGGMAKGPNTAGV